MQATYVHGLADDEHNWLLMGRVSPLYPAERKSTEQYWLVGVSAKELQSIVCANAAEPAVPSGNQRPVVTAVPLRPPVVALDAAVAPFEADLVR